MQLKILHEAIILNRSTKFLARSSWPHTYSPSVSLFMDIWLEKYIKNKTIAEKLIKLFRSPWKILKEKGEKAIR